MHDWAAGEAVDAAERRHRKVLARHWGQPVSDGKRLEVVCGCRTIRSSIATWEAHLLKALAEDSPTLDTRGPNDRD